MAPTAPPESICQVCALNSDPTDPPNDVARAAAPGGQAEPTTVVGTLAAAAAAGAGAAPDPLEAASAGAAGGAIGAPASGPAGRALRVLNGPHGGAQVAIEAERLLVGNLEHECDIVLDVTVPERHACLLRVGPDGWTVLAIAGDLWVGAEYLAAPHTRDITPAEVLTLGRVSFTVVDSTAASWAGVKPPLTLVKPVESQNVPRMPLLPSKKEFVQRWTTVTVVTGASIGALVLAAAGVLLAQAWREPAADPAAVEQRLREWQERLSELPYGRELRVQASTDHRHRLVVRGYLPRAADRPLLEAFLLQGRVEAELRTEAVDTTAAELARRIGDVARESVRYLGSGVFELQASASDAQRLEQRARQTLQEMPSVMSLRLVLVPAVAGAVPGELRLGRAHEGAAEISVQRPTQVVPPEPAASRAPAALSVREVRLGRLPSVVLTQGARYFEGATLPDGSMIVRIQPDRLLLQEGATTRSVPIRLDNAPAAAGDGEQSSAKR